MSNYIDISPLISERTGVFPGDVAFSRKIALDFKSGDHLLLSAIQTTLHIGAHVDGPNHYSPTGEGIATRSLSIYMGPCLVLEAKGHLRGERIGLRHFAKKWQGLSSWPAPRILVRTGSFSNPEAWNSDFCSLEPELLEHWARTGIKLIGIDTPSIDPEDSKTLDAHRVVARHDMAILEGVVLDAAPEGLYSLVALPLRIENADASPVRAVLFRDARVFD